MGPLAGLLDEEMSRASAHIVSDPERAAEVETAFAAMVAGEPSKESLSAFVDTTFDAPASDRLAALVAAMSEAEIAEFFRTASLSVVRTTIDATNTVDLWIYACQEDIPFSSLVGFEALRDSDSFPQVTEVWREGAVAPLRRLQPVRPAPARGLPRPHRLRHPDPRHRWPLGPADLLAVGRRGDPGVHERPRHGGAGDGAWIALLF